MSEPRKPGDWRARLAIAPIDIDAWCESDDPAVLDFVQTRIDAMKERIEGFIEQELLRLLPGATVTWSPPESENLESDTADF